MKIKLIILVLLLFCSTAWAADVKFAMDVGALLQTGSPGKLAYGANTTTKYYGLDDSGRHYLSGLTSFLRSDLDGDTYLGRMYPIYYQRPLITLGKVPFNIGGGIGRYWNMKSDGDDETDLAHILTLSVETWKLAAMIKAEAYEYEGPDMYFVGGSVLFLF